jgi:hypothetical protein
MHEQHPVFEAPSNIDIPIWRYMNLAKFISMLQDGALHFARADQMADEFEGSISKPTLSLRHEMLAGIPDINPEILSGATALMGQSRKNFREHIYLNCWHMNEVESAAMWDLYLGGEAQGIAVRSTYRRLSDSITDERVAYVGTVNYVNFDDEIIPDRNVPHPYLYKRKSFEHEREIRALHIGIDLELNLAVIPIAVDLDRLVEAVYVSPKAKDWFERLIRNELKRYDRNWEVIHSDLDNDPIY